MREIQGERGAQVLVVGADDLAAAVSQLLARRGLSTLSADDLASAAQQLEGRAVTACLLALPLRGQPGLTALTTLQQRAPGLPIIVLGTDASLPTAVDGLEAGAADHLADGLAAPARLLASVGTVAGARVDDLQLGYLRRRELADASLTTLERAQPGLAPIAEALRAVSRQARPRLHIAGPPGVGKAYLARCLHVASPRHGQAFVRVACARRGGNALLGELFGRERGALPESPTAYAGALNIASGGTLLLADVDALDGDGQAQLLEALRGGASCRLGGAHRVHFDVQLVSTSRVALETCVTRGTFSAELAAALTVRRLWITPLAERPDDVVPLASHLLCSLCDATNTPAKQLSADAKSALRAHRWPGNARELHNELERLVLLEPAPVLTSAHLRPTGATRRAVAIHGDGDAFQVELPEGGAPLELIERAVLSEALARTGGNVTRAARLVSISRQTLIYRMKRHGLS